MITTPKGQTYRRNRRHLRPEHTTQEDEKIDSDDDTEIPTDDGGGHDMVQTANSPSVPTGLPPLRRSTRTTPRPFSYADPYTIQF